MKRANKVWLVAMLALASTSYGQDVQELYEGAKEALLRGNYGSALEMIADAQKEIMAEPKRDPNGTFKNKLLPLVETNARNMGNIDAALEELYIGFQSGMEFPDLLPSREALDQYRDKARSYSQELMDKRDAILSSYELAPEYRAVVRTLPVVKRIEQLASVGIVEKLSDKYASLVGVLTDSLKSVDGRLRALVARADKLAVTSAANKAELEKVKNEVAQLSEERLNYISSISEMLAGEVKSEMDPLRVALQDNQVEDVFQGVIKSEILRLQGVAEVDSAEYKDMLHNYERIQNYNEIFSKNKVAANQTELMAQYAAAMGAVKVNTPEKSKLWIYLVIAGLGVLIALVLVYTAGQKTVKKNMQDQLPLN